MPRCPDAIPLGALALALGCSPAVPTSGAKRAVSTVSSTKEESEGPSEPLIEARTVEREWKPTPYVCSSLREDAPVVNADFPSFPDVRAKGVDFRIVGAYLRCRWITPAGWSSTVNTADNLLEAEAGVEFGAGLLCSPGAGLEGIEELFAAARVVNFGSARSFQCDERFA